MEDLDPGLQGYSDSGSDFHDLPAPELPKGLRKTCLEASDGGGVTLKRPNPGDAVVLQCRPCPEKLKHLQNDQGLICLDLDSAAAPAWLLAAASSLRLSERARFEGPLLADLALGEGIERLGGRSINQ
ncbi:unnamed protein product [Cladocopium goreaui]|uniref:Uncharacterized protein n=1 Tax=Cladocopium goreaui TaxID=2562237 RepID=A0A9P1DEF8_9DINO|nr:unnamed protein product [Cladocopium goreaui]